VEDFLMREGFVEEREASGRRHYVKTESGELFHRLLKNGNMIKSLLRVSGKWLRRY
jgi:hypothetical protein